MAEDLKQPTPSSIESAIKYLLKDQKLHGIAVLTMGEDGSIALHVEGTDDLKQRALLKWAESILNAGFPVIPFKTVFGVGNEGKPMFVDRNIPVMTGWEEFAYGPKA